MSAILNLAADTKIGCQQSVTKDNLPFVEQLVLISTAQVVAAMHFSYTNKASHVMSLKNLINGVPYLVTRRNFC